MNILIVGASSGIGREVAHIFSREGHDVICSSRDEKELEYLICDLKIRYGNNAYAVPGDLTETYSVENFVEKIYGTFKDLDCVIITAGTMPGDTKPYHDKEELVKTTMTNYIGIALILNEISSRMAVNKSGLIICFSSVAGERGRMSNFVYGASKAALIHYLQGLRMRMHKHGVHVMTVLPGYVDTLMAYGKVKAHFAVSPGYVARKIYKASETKKNTIYIPGVWWLIMKIIKSVPETIFKRLNF